MKFLYLLLTTLSLILWVLIGTMSFATTPAEATASQLKGAPDQWRIEKIEVEGSALHADEAELKANLLDFFKQAGFPTHRRIEHFGNLLLVILAFSLTGYLRERWLARPAPKAKPCLTPDP